MQEIGLEEKLGLLLLGSGSRGSEAAPSNKNGEHLIGESCPAGAGLIGYMVANLTV